MAGEVLGFWPGGGGGVGRRGNKCTCSGLVRPHKTHTPGEGGEIREISHWPTGFFLFFFIYSSYHGLVYNTQGC